MKDAKSRTPYDGLATTTVCILAGEFGSRLGGIVRNVPKPLLNVAGEPFLLHQLRLLPVMGRQEWCSASVPRQPDRRGDRYSAFLGSRSGTATTSPTWTARWTRRAEHRHGLASAPSSATEIPTRKWTIRPSWRVGVAVSCPPVWAVFRNGGARIGPTWSTGATACSDMTRVRHRQGQNGSIMDSAVCALAL
jgi:hypothetical protein